MSFKHNKATDRLFQVIMNLNSLDECYDFFTDICTVKELQDMSQRLSCAILLGKGASYQNISNEIGLSAATIGRVSRCLNYGSGGYERALEIIKENNIDEEV